MDGKTLRFLRSCQSDEIAARMFIGKPALLFFEEEPCPIWGNHAAARMFNQTDYLGLLALSPFRHDELRSLYIQAGKQPGQLMSIDLLPTGGMGEEERRNCHVSVIQMAGRSAFLIDFPGGASGPEAERIDWRVQMAFFAAGDLLACAFDADRQNLGCSDGFPQSVCTYFSNRGKPQAGDLEQGALEIAAARYEFVHFAPGEIRLLLIRAEANLVGNIDKSAALSLHDRPSYPARAADASQPPDYTGVKRQGLAPSHHSALRANFALELDREGVIRQASAGFHSLAGLLSGKSSTIWPPKGRSERSLEGSLEGALEGLFFLDIARQLGFAHLDDFAESMSREGDFGPVQTNLAGLGSENNAQLISVTLTGLAQRGARAAFTGYRIFGQIAGAASPSHAGPQAKRSGVDDLNSPIMSDILPANVQIARRETAYEGDIRPQQAGETGDKDWPAMLTAEEAEAFEHIAQKLPHLEPEGASNFPGGKSALARLFEQMRINLSRLKLSLEGFGKSNRGLRALLAEMSVFSLSLTGEGRIVNCNEDIALRLGVPADGLFGKRFSDFVPTEDRHLLDACFAHARAGWGDEKNLRLRQIGLLAGLGERPVSRVTENSAGALSHHKQGSAARKERVRICVFPALPHKNPGKTDMSHAERASDIAVFELYIIPQTVWSHREK